ncbi:MAG: FecR family protein, partial [Syntrophales bacterium LBB04]|nr:FecR family protein [Syntrophales bacterium LBB04]
MHNSKVMKRQSVTVMFLLLGCAMMLFLPPVTHAAQIGKVASFKGDVTLSSAGVITKLTKPGIVLNDGDLIQTRDGEVQISFTDGAVLKLNPYSQTVLQERTEQRGAWIFKTKENARRVTCFAGKLWFKSGTASSTKNFLQSPPAVAGLWGADGDFGYNPGRLE